MQMPQERETRYTGEEEQKEGGEKERRGERGGTRGLTKVTTLPACRVTELEGRLASEFRESREDVVDLVGLKDKSRGGNRRRVSEERETVGLRF